MDTAKNLLTVRQAAARLGVSPSLVYALCAARKLRHARVGVGRGKIVVPEGAIEAYLEGRTVEAGAASVPTRPRPRPVTLKHLRLPS